MIAGWLALGFEIGVVLTIGVVFVVNVVFALVFVDLLGDLGLVVPVETYGLGFFISFFLSLVAAPDCPTGFWLTSGFLVSISVWGLALSTIVTPSIT